MSRKAKVKAVVLRFIVKDNKCFFEVASHGEMTLGEFAAFIANHEQLAEIWRRDATTKYGEEFWSLLQEARAKLAPPNPFERKRKE